jgi:hypothetical protein
MVKQRHQQGKDERSSHGRILKLANLCLAELKFVESIASELVAMRQALSLAQKRKAGTQRRHDAGAERIDWRGEHRAVLISCSKQIAKPGLRVLAPWCLRRIGILIYGYGF